MHLVAVAFASAAAYRRHDVVMRRGEVNHIPSFVLRRHNGCMTGAFNARVYEVVKSIPKGQVATYGQVAALAGNPRNARFVGFALHANPKPGVIPCHRVVFRDGSLAPGFAFGGPDRQRQLLEEEGVRFLPPQAGQSGDEGWRVDLDHCQWQQ